MHSSHLASSEHHHHHHQDPDHHVQAQSGRPLQPRTAQLALGQALRQQEEKASTICFTGFLLACSLFMTVVYYHKPAVNFLKTNKLKVSEVTCGVLAGRIS